MAAESLPFTLETVSSWELEAWYEDLQEVLSSDEIGGTYISSPGNEEEESKTFTTLDPASLAWLTEEPGPTEVTPHPKALALQIPVRVLWPRRKRRKSKEELGNGNRVVSAQPGLGSNA